MLLMLVANLAFGWMAASALPAWFSGDFGLLLIRTNLSFALTIATLSTAVTLIGVGGGLASRRMEPLAAPQR